MAENTVVKVSQTATEAADFNPSLSDWNTLVSGAHTVTGFDQAKDELADALVGVPFLITRVEFRPGMGVADCVMWVETIIADAEGLRRRRVNMADFPFEPYSQVGFNDGGTGIYRQIIAYLVASGMITLTDAQMKKPEGGLAGESRYDVRPPEFAEIHAGDYDGNDNGEFFYGLNIRLVCPRGLRLSEYDHPKAGKAKTRYIG